MTTSATPCARLRSLVQGKGDNFGIAVPRAHRLAARIQEREWEAFTCDPTQLANGLRDLADAVAPDGLAVCLDDVLLEAGPVVLGSPQYAAALEATRRLKASMGERAVLVACLPGPRHVTGGSDALLEIGKAFLGAGIDALVVLAEDGETADLATLANIARFHQALALGSTGGLGLPAVELMPLDMPRAARGLALTDCHLPRETDITELEDWVDTVRG